MTTKDDTQSIAESTVYVSASELKMFQETFNLFDKDGDGCITTQELSTVMSTLGRHVTLKQVEDMLKKIDKDGNGTVEFEEFIQLMKSDSFVQDDIDSDSELLAAFRVFDKDDNGSISADELRKVLSGLGVEINDEDVEDMIKEVDVNGDGVVDYEEFVAMLTGNTSRVPSRVSCFSSMVDFKSSDFENEESTD